VLSSLCKGLLISVISPHRENERADELRIGELSILPSLGPQFLLHFSAAIHHTAQDCRLAIGGPVSPLTSHAHHMPHDSANAHRHSWSDKRKRDAPRPSTYYKPAQRCLQPDIDSQVVGARWLRRTLETQVYSSKLRVMWLQ
jgi:hypothetical protein